MNLKEIEELEALLPNDFELKQETAKEKARIKTVDQFKNKEARQRHSEISKKVAQRPDYKTKQENSKKIKSIKLSKAHLELNAAPGFREFKSNCIKEALQDPIKHQNLLDGVKTREANGWHEKNKTATQSPTAKKKRSESLRNQSQEQKDKRRKAVQKPIVTPEGVFESCKAAGLYYNTLLNFNNGAKYVGTRLKLKEPGYAYISKEEYIMLTGKE